MKKGLKGSYTVEASVITTFVFFLTIVIIFSFFIAYDKASISFNIKRTLLWSKAETLEGLNVDGSMIAEKAQELQGYLVTTDKINYDGNADGEAVSLTCQGRSKIVSEVARVFGMQEEGQEWIMEAKSIIRRPEYTLRILRVLNKEKKRWKLDIEEN